MTDATTAGRDRPQTRRRKSLSDKQLAILEVIQRSIARHGYPPSMREIGDAVGLKSLSSVTHQLNQLELSGYLRRDPGKTRAMEVLIDLPGAAAENPADTAPALGDAALVPLVGIIVLIVFWCQDSDPAPNQHGPSPKYQAAGGYGY